MDTTIPFRTSIRHFAHRDDAPMARCGVRWPKRATVDPRDVTCYRCLHFIDLVGVQTAPHDDDHDDADDDRPGQ